MGDRDPPFLTDKVIGLISTAPDQQVQVILQVKGAEGEIEIRQIFELEEFGESPAIDRARELENELPKNK